MCCVLPWRMYRRGELYTLTSAQLLKDPTSSSSSSYVQLIELPVPQTWSEPTTRTGGVSPHKWTKKPEKRERRAELHPANNRIVVVKSFHVLVDGLMAEIDNSHFVIGYYFRLQLDPAASTWRRPCYFYVFFRHYNNCPCFILLREKEKGFDYRARDIALPLRLYFLHARRRPISISFCPSSACLPVSFTSRNRFSCIFSIYFCHPFKDKQIDTMDL